MEHRYDDKAHAFDEQLGEDLAELTKQAKTEAPATAESGLDRIVKKTPLEEVKAVIESRAKSAEDEMVIHRVREKLAEIKNRGPRTVEDFLGSMKDG